MAWRIVQQPNKLFARFSEIVDNFTHLDMTYDQAVMICEREHSMQHLEALAKVERAIENPDRWKEALKIVKAIHGRKGLRELTNELAQPPTERER